MPRADDWRESAACREVDPELFFAETAEGVRAAKSVCAVCPVRDECVAVALARPERFGIWGGLTPTERRDLLHRPSRRAA